MVVRSFLAAVVTFFALVLVSMHVVDPRGDFGTGIFPVVVRDSRATKMQLFRAMHSRQPVEGFILGASRSMKLSPEQLTRLSGVRFFNFAVDSARGEDYLAIYRWVRQQGATPRLLIIGLDVEALHDNDKFDSRLAKNRALRQTLSDTRSWAMLDRISAYKNALSVEYLKDALLVLRRSLRPGDHEVFHFEADGYLNYVQWDIDRARGISVFERRLTTCLEEYEARFHRMTTLSTRRKGYLEETIRQARGDGARVIVFLTPLHPVTVRYVERRTPYKDLLRQTQIYLGELGARFDISVFDYSDPSRYNGTLGGWYDCGHTDEQDSALIAMTVLQADRR